MTQIGFLINRLRLLLDDAVFHGHYLFIYTELLNNKYDYAIMQTNTIKSLGDFS